jgi:hypothetical protein
MNVSRFDRRDALEIVVGALAGLLVLTLTGLPISGAAPDVSNIPPPAVWCTASRPVEQDRASALLVQSGASPSCARR